MRTIVIGDVHGCYNELKELISALEENNEYDKNIDKIVFLGDYIDRGKDSRLVIEFVRKLQKEHNNVIALMGNHEDMLIDYRDGLNHIWLYNGYDTTKDSYEGFDEQFEDDVNWMRSLPLYHEDEHFVYVHAGINPTIKMNKQDKNTLLWVREEFIYDERAYDKTVIFGHTPTANLNGSWMPVETFADHVGIDTGCVFGGALTALIIKDGEIDGFYQVNKNVSAFQTN